MKQLIKQILKEESLKQDLKQSVKDYGWESTAKLIGKPKDLARLAFNNDPMEYLNLFNDLNVSHYDRIPEWTLFFYDKKNNIFIYDNLDKVVHFKYDIIWEFLQYGFELEYSDTQSYCEKWLKEAYNIKGVDAKWGRIIFDGVDE
jgi:hypothetical protein